PHPPISTFFPYTTLFRSPTFNRRSFCISHSFRCIHQLSDWRFALIVWCRQFLHRFCLLFSAPGTVLDCSELNRSSSGRYRLSLRSEEHTSELQSRENLVC